MPKEPTDPKSPLSPGALRRNQTSGVVLDPYGVYQTRSTTRRLAARGRKQWQIWVAMVVTVAAVVAALMSLRRPREPWGTQLAQSSLWSRPLAQPALSPQGGWLVPTESGQLFSVPHLFGPLPTPDSASLGQALFSVAFPLRATPALTESLALVPSQDGVLYAIDRHSGKLVWQHAWPDSITTAPVIIPVDESMPSAPPTVEGAAEPGTPLQLVVEGDDQGHLAALDTSNGQLVWSHNLAGPIGNGLVYSTVDNKLFVPYMPDATAMGGLVCLSGRSGKVLWSFPAGAHAFGAGVNPPALQLAANGSVAAAYFATDDGFMYRFSPTGQKVWKVAVPALTPQSDNLVTLRGAPEVFPASGLVIVGGEDGAWRALDLNTGKLLWVFNAGQPCRLAPQLLQLEVGPALLVSSTAPRLWALNPVTGLVMRRWELRAAPVGLSVRSEKVAVVQEQGTVQWLAP